MGKRLLNRTYREEVLGTYLFESTEQVQRIADDWLVEYNELRPHELYRASTAADLPAEGNEGRRVQRQTVHITGGLRLQRSLSANGSGTKFDVRSYCDVFLMVYLIGSLA
jgi:hypothetical protein